LKFGFKKPVMKKLILIILIFLSLPLISFSQGKKKALYFYSETCSHCYKVDQYFTANNIYNDFEIKKLDTADPENLKALSELFDVYKIAPENRGWPVIFFADTMLIGDQDIIDNFVNKIGVADASEFPTVDSVKRILEKKAQDAAIEGKNNNNNNYNSIPFPLLVSAALADALNPCALAVLILLLATVMAAKGKNRALISGLAFSFAVFSSYLMMGLGLYKAITAFSLPHYFSLAVAIFAILIGLANLKDVFWYGKVFIMEVPLKWRPKMQEALKKVTGPVGAMGAGYLVSLFLVPCASGPYIVLLSKLAEKVDTAKTIPLLIVYNLIFVLPMIIITLAMYFGSARMGKLEQWRQKNLRLLHAITAGLMLFIGGYLLYYLK
jgi:cytochrome c biogenesis protein CcdA/glutaredoxin